MRACLCVVHMGDCVHILMWSGCNLEVKFTLLLMKPRALQAYCNVIKREDTVILFTLVQLS